MIPLRQAREELIEVARKRQEEVEAERASGTTGRASSPSPGVHGVALASQADTTLDEVLESHADGATIAEFPTTLEAAEAGALDILSSDYVPFALLMAAFRVVDIPAVGGLPGAFRMVTKMPAEATVLMDRSEIKPGLRADLLRVATHDGEPVVRAVWREGRRIA